MRSELHFGDCRPTRGPVRLLALGFKRLASMKCCGPFFRQDDPARSEMAASAHGLIDITFSPRRGEMLSHNASVLRCAAVLLEGARRHPTNSCGVRRVYYPG